MKALVLESYNNLVYRDVPEPEIEGDEVLVRVKACGICGSDVHGMDGSTGRRIPPLVMGHEASGVIELTGSGVGGYSEGDCVTFDSTIYCGVCGYCRQGLVNLCDNRRVLGVACDEYSRDGAFAEYVAVPERILYRLPEGLSFERAAMVEPLSIAFHAVELADLSLNESAVVIGAGIIGLFVVQLLRAAGCGRIVAVDVDENRLDTARSLGAHETVLSRGEGTADDIGRALGRDGADAAFEAVGIPSTVATAVESLRKGGRCVLVGNLTPTVDLPLQKTVARQLTLLGSCASSGEYPDCLDMIVRGAVDVDTLMSATAPLSDGAGWFRRLYGGERGLFKVLLIP